VPRSLLSRLAAAIVAVSAGFAVPSSALAHGYAHGQEAAQFRNANDVTGATSDSRQRSLLPGEAATGVEAAEHPHPTVDTVLTARAPSLFVAIVAAHVALPFGSVAWASARHPVPSVQIRVEAAHAPPPRLRAPPALLG